MRAVIVNVLALLLAVGTAVPAASSERCGSAMLGAHCTISNSGTQVDLAATTVKPGGDTAGGTSNSPGSRSHPARPAPKPTLTANPCTTPLCRDSYSVANASDVYPEVSLADLASFRPHAVTAHNEPAGVAVIGMPSNVVAGASAHELHGELLGFAVTVRFEPVNYTFDYGDGSTHTAETGGATWAALGQAEYTPTRTSHVFRERGTHRITVWAGYRASVLFDGSYRREVAGIVRGPAQSIAVRVVAVRTALVENTCAERPAGPGC